MPQAPGLWWLVFQAQRESVAILRFDLLDNGLDTFLEMECAKHAPERRNAVVDSGRRGRVGNALGVDENNAEALAFLALLSPVGGLVLHPLAQLNAADNHVLDVDWRVDEIRQPVLRGIDCVVQHHFPFHGVGGKAAKLLADGGVVENANGAVVDSSQIVHGLSLLINVVGWIGQLLGILAGVFVRVTAAGRDKQIQRHGEPLSMLVLVNENGAVVGLAVAGNFPAAQLLCRRYSCLVLRRAGGQVNVGKDIIVDFDLSCDSLHCGKPLLNCY